VGKRNDAWCIKDYKTTGAYKTDDYFASYRMSHQLLTYVWAVKWHVDKYSGESPFYAQMFNKRIGAYIDGIFLSSTKTEFKPSDIFFFDDEMLSEYTTGVSLLLMEIDKDLEAGTIPHRQGISNGTCSGNFGDCPFFNMCSAPDSIAEERFLENKFARKVYDPLNR
jgi:hypothetical protein